MRPGAVPTQTCLCSLFPHQLNMWFEAAPTPPRARAQAGDGDAVAAVDSFFRNTLNVPCVPAPARAGAAPRTAAADMPPPPRIPGPRPPAGAPAGGPGGAGGSQTPKAVWAPGAPLGAGAAAQACAARGPHVRVVCASRILCF